MLSALKFQTENGAIDCTHVAITTPWKHETDVLISRLSVTQCISYHCIISSRINFLYVSLAAKTELFLTALYIYQIDSRLFMLTLTFPCTQKLAMEFHRVLY